MAILTTSAGPVNASIRTLYASDYKEAAEYETLYGQLSHPVAKDGVEAAARLGQTLRVSFLQDIPPGTETIPQTADVTPINIIDAYAEISPTSRYVGPIQWAERLDMDVYTNLTSQRYKQIGKAMSETVDSLACDAALQGSNIIRTTIRASLDADTTSHYWNGAAMEQAEVILQTLKCRPFISNGRSQWIAIAHPALFYDLRNSDTILPVAQYQKNEIILNHELGQLGSFKLIISPWAKVFIGQGAACSTAVSTTVGTATSALDKTLTCAASTNLASGYKWLNIIDTAETSNTHVRTNERVRYVSNSAAVVTLLGEGANGGMRFAHSTSATVTNADSVYAVAYGGPFSLAKMYDGPTGAYGQIVGPKISGMLDQFSSLGGKFYGGFGRWVEPWMLRGEYTASLDANG